MTESSEAPAPRKNRAAVTALCLGMVSCVPVMGLGAIAFGVVGLRRAYDPRYDRASRPLAMFGVILGILGVFWSAMLAGAGLEYHYRRQYTPAIEAQATFLRLLGSGQIGSARGMSDEAIDEIRLTEAFEELERHGALIDFNNNYVGKMHSRADVEVTSELKFERATRLFTGHWSVEGAAPRLMRFAIIDPPATQPGR